MWAEYDRFMAACRAWQAELVREYGKRAGDYRYTPKGAATPKLRALRDEFDKAGAEWRLSCRKMG